MKFIHLSDLHIGKRVNEFSMLEDQRFILTQILEIIKHEQPDAVLIAGDIYDITQPSVEAINLLDDFLDELFSLKIHTMIISGNHDSAERISFGSNRMVEHMHICPAYDGLTHKVTLSDENGEVDFFMLPFVKPVTVRSIFPDEEILDYTGAVKSAISHMNVDATKRNVLIAHQFVTGATRCDSEEISLGGQDNIDASVFSPFDYVALGHIHGPQKVERDTIRYCGTPLKYSFSEKNHNKSVTVVQFNSKDDIQISTQKLKPLHDMREIRGSYAEIITKTKSEDYIRVILTDETPIPDALSELRKTFPNIMRLEYDNSRTRLIDSGTQGIQNAKQLNPMEIFSTFYRERTQTEMDKRQADFVKKLIQEIWEES